MKDTKLKAVRRLYSLYPEQVVKLEQLSISLGINQSKLLRHLIDEQFEKVTNEQSQHAATN
jgi:hypothetical protein